jgi:hypothetical protein
MIIAAFLRFHHLLDIEHNVDHAYPIWQALTTLDKGVFPLAGQGTSVLFANPALTGYLYLPFIAITRSPLGAYVLVITLNTLGVFLAFRAAKGLLGIRPALVATLLLAVNPWIIEYSRATWVQSLLPFFAPALAWLLWPVLLGQSKNPARRTVLALIILTMYTQTYLLVFIVLAPVLLLIVIFRRNVPLRGLVMGGIIFALATLVYGIGLLGQADTVGARLGEFSGNPSRLSGVAWSHGLRLVSGEDYELVRGQAAPIRDAVLRHDLTRIAHVVLALAVVVGIGLAAMQLVPEKWRYFVSRQKIGNRQAATILLLWFGLPIVLMSYVGQPVHPFYQLIGLPAGHILAAWGLCAVLRPDRGWGIAILMVLAVPFAVLMGVNSSRFAEETAATAGIDRLGALPLEYGLQLGHIINELLPPGGMVFADVDEWTLNSLAGKTFPLSRDTRAPAVQIIPTSGALYIQVNTSEAEPLPDASRVESLTLRDSTVLTVDLYPANTMPAIIQPLHISSQERIAFLGYDLSQENQTVQLTTFWKIESLIPESGESLFAPFIHIFDGAGSRVQIVDGEILAGKEWRIGDIHIHRLTFILPESGAPFTLQVGQYDSIHNQNVIFLPDYTPTIQLPKSLSE